MVANFVIDNFFVSVCMCQNKSRQENCHEDKCFIQVTPLQLPHAEIHLTSVFDKTTSST